MNRNKKAAAAEDETIKTEFVKRRGILGKLGMKKKSKSPVEMGEEKPEHEETAEETTPVGEEAAPAEEEPTSEPLEPEAEKKDEEEPADEDKEEDEAADERDNANDDEAVPEEPIVEEQSAHVDVAPDADDRAEIEEREQPEPTTPRTAQSTGFLCGCL
jgi:hypothetical protein